MLLDANGIGYVPHWQISSTQGPYSSRLRRGLTHLDNYNDGALEEHERGCPEDVEGDADDHVRRERLRPLLRRDPHCLRARGRADRARVVGVRCFLHFQCVGEVGCRGKFGDIGGLGAFMQKLHLADIRSECRKTLDFAAALDYL